MTVHHPPGIRCLPRNNSRKRDTLYRVYIAVFTFLCYTCYHITRKPISVVKSVLHEVGPVNSSEPSWVPFDKSNYLTLLGSLDYAFLFSYTVGMFFSGYIAERSNIRYFLSFGMITTGIFTAAFGFAYFADIHAFSYFIIVQIVAGLFSSTGWPSVVECMGNWFGQGRRGLIMGAWNSHTSVGNILGSLIAGIWVSKAWGWSFVVPGIISVAVGILVFFFLTPHPQDVGCSPPNTQYAMNMDTSLIGTENNLNPEEELRAISIKEALWLPGVVEYSMSLFFCKLVSYTFLFWLPQYIHATTEYSAENSANLSTLFDIGGIVGGMLAGYASDKTRMSAATCAVMLLFAPPSMLLYHKFSRVNFTLNVVLLLVSGGLVNGPYALITTAVSADLGTHKSLRNTKAIATVTSIIDGTGSLGAAVGPLLTGIIARGGWDGVFYMLIAADVFGLILLLRLVAREISWYRIRS